MPPSGNRLAGQDYHWETTGLWQFTPLRATSGEDKLILADNADGKQDPAPGQAIAVRSCCGHKLALCCPCPIDVRVPGWLSSAPTWGLLGGGGGCPAPARVW